MKLAIIGAGAVGSTVARLADSYGHSVVALADSKSSVIDPSGIDVSNSLEEKSTTGSFSGSNVEEAITADYECLIDTTPTTLDDVDTSFGYITTALERDRHVVLSNKGPVAQRYRELKEHEARSEGEVRFESTVGGSLPVISTIQDVGPQRVTRVRGVFNRLANFILSRMAKENLGYEHVLAEAQELGIAEVDPTFDVEGTDSGLTCAILANVLSPPDKEFTIDDVNIEGITQIPGSALKLGKEDGKTVRLIGEVGTDQIEVTPQLVSQNSPLAVTGAQTVVGLDIQNAGPLNVLSSTTTNKEIATTILTDVNRISRSK